MLPKYSHVLKRAIDVFLSSIILILISPLLVLLSLAVWINSGRPIIFKIQVVGKNGKPFTLYKFRTMVPDAHSLKEKYQGLNEMSGPMFKIKNDPRVTQCGRFLRKYSLDELPQLWCVLKGDMSLVGPRAPMPEEYKKFEDWQKRKLSVTPGITCIWQVNGRSKINDFDDWVRMDLEYIDNWSHWLDFKILFKTIPAVLSGRGAH